MRKLFFPLLLIPTLTILFGCDKADEKIKGLLNHDPKPQSKTVVILTDLSGSTQKLRTHYEENIANVIPAINHGDVFIVAKITASSVTEPELPVKAEFPEFVPLDKFNRKVDNELMVRNLRKEADGQLTAKKAELTQKLKDKNSFLYRNDKIMNTDIMSSISLASKIFNSFKRDKSVLIILSDMIEDSGPYNFDKIKLSKNNIGSIIEKAKSDNKIPDLTNVKIYVIAAGTKTSDKFKDVQDFWERYFKEANAVFSTSNYSNTLLNFKE